MNWRPRLAWTLAVYSFLVILADSVILAVSFGLMSEVSLAEHAWPLIPAASVGSGVVGALIVSRLPRQPIGWLLTSVGVAGSTALFGESYSMWVIEKNGPGPELPAHWAGWAATLIGSPIILPALAIVFLIAPDGQLLSRRWRIPAVAGPVGSGFFCAALFTVSPSKYDLHGTTAENSLGETPTSNLLIAVFFLLLLVAIIGAALSMVLRLRRASGEMRQQLWCFALAALSLASASAWLVLAGIPIEDESLAWVVFLPLALAYFLLPIFIGVALLRYKLYNVDLIVNRAVLLTVGTGFAALGYIGVVVALSAVAGTALDDVWLSLSATALVALAFQPVRRRMIRLADRLVYGARAAPYDALSAFSRRIGRSPTTAGLLPAVADAAGRAVGASAATARLEVAGHPDLVATWPTGALEGEVSPAPTAGRGSPAAESIEVDVTDRAGHLGGIHVKLAPGGSLRSHERRLLQDIAEQAAVAFRNARLEAELSASVSMLDHRTVDLAASRRRLIEAGDAERRRLEASISREVLPALAHLESDLAAGERVAIDVLMMRAGDALESLRGLTRGIFPTMLARLGLAPALSSHLSRLGLVGVLDVDESAAGRRFPARTEAAAYFCVAEAVRDARRPVQVHLEVAANDLVLRVVGAAADDMDRLAMTDRVHAVGGGLQVTGKASASVGSDLMVILPVGADLRSPELVGSA